MDQPETVMDRYLREAGEKISGLAARMNRSPSTLTRALSGTRNPSLDLARDVEKATAGKVPATEFIAICMAASSMQETSA